MAESHLETLCPPSSLESVRFDPSGEADEKPSLPCYPDLGTQNGILEGGDPGYCVLGCRSPETAWPV